MFSPPIINDYINQLEALKRDGKENKESQYIIDKYNREDIQLNESLLDNVDFANSWLLNCIGIYYYPKAIEWYIKSANLGNSWAMCNLGCYYDEIEKDYPKAIEWYTKSANLGNTSAMNNLGYYYEHTEKDYPKAIEWYIKSANLGNTMAMFNLGIYYYNIEKDYQKAIEWYTKLANLGNSSAIYNLYLCYKKIDNIKESIKWLIKSAELDNQHAIGYLYHLNIDENLYDYVYELCKQYKMCIPKDDIMKYLDYEIYLKSSKTIRNILISKLPALYIYNKKDEEINNLKSIKTQGIDNVLINEIIKHF